jgi:hypothetical protein
MFTASVCARRTPWPNFRIVQYFIIRPLRHVKAMYLYISTRIHLTNLVLEKHTHTQTQRITRTRNSRQSRSPHLSHRRTNNIIAVWQNKLILMLFGDSWMIGLWDKYVCTFYMSLLYNIARACVSYNVRCCILYICWGFVSTLDLVGHPKQQINGLQCWKDSHWFNLARECLSNRWVCYENLYLRMRGNRKWRWLSRELEAIIFKVHVTI